MSSPNVANLLRVPGRLSYGPTDLTAAYPHGGTALGTMGRVDVVQSSRHFNITAEEFGGSISDAIYLGEDARLSVTLREFDADTLAIMFPIYSAGAQFGPTLEADANASVRAGSLLSALAVVLVFTPDSPDQYPMVLMRRAIPMIPETARMNLRATDEMNFACVFALTPDANGKQFAIGNRREITL